MFVIPPEPTKDEIDQLRNSVISQLSSDGLLDTLHPYDIKRFKTEDDYPRRFLMHHDNDQALASEMVISTLKWRSETKVNEITAESLDQDLLKKGSLDIHNRDIDGCKILLFSVRLHLKGGNQDKLKKILIYWIERLEREEQGKWITVFFDMRETGMKNMDMEFIQYLIHLFKDYYPWILNYIIVFEMPWLLNAMWKIIKGWLPPKSIEKIKFVDKKSIQEFVPSDQCIEGWGGADAYEFKFIPEKEQDSSPIMNGDIEGKKVHFEQEKSALSTEKKLDVTSSKTASKFSINPAEELVFKGGSIGTNSVITLSNKSTSQYAFKIKTTSPDKYRVRPSMGLVEPDGQTDINVTVSDNLSPGLLVKDKFLIIALPCATDSISTNEFVQLQKNTNATDVMEMRLRVGLIEPEVPSAAAVKTQISISPQLMSKIDSVLTNQKVMEEKIASLRRMLYLVLLLVIAFLFVFVVTTNNLTSSLLAQQTQASSCPALNHGDHYVTN